MPGHGDGCLGPIGDWGARAGGRHLRVGTDAGVGVLVLFARNVGCAHGDGARGVDLDGFRGVFRFVGHVGLSRPVGGKGH